MSGTPGKVVDIATLNAARIGNNFLTKKGLHANAESANLLSEYVQYVLSDENQRLPSYKVGLLMVAINQNYWPYAKQVIDGVKGLFLPGHTTEVMLWTDIPSFAEAKDVNFGATVFPTDSVEWPYPTLMRYHLFLAQEEYLKQFDYLFYLDLDMRVVGFVGDEILPKEGLMMAAHPMYWLQDNLVPPYEPDERSSAHIKMPGRVVSEGEKNKFQPLYAAGGFQGGKTGPFIDAMKAMRDGIDKDFDISYVARWNDESHWNKYLSEHPPEVVLDPSYVYPDSLIQEYYVPKVWGRDFNPRIITITKPFTVSKEGGEAAKKIML